MAFAAVGGGGGEDRDVSGSNRRRWRWSAGPGKASAVLEGAGTLLAVSAWVTAGVNGGRRRRGRGFGRWPGRPTALAVVGRAGEGVGGVCWDGKGVGGVDGSDGQR